jgi:hypothetical protein
MEQRPENRQMERKTFPYPVLIELINQEQGTFEHLQNQGQGIDISSQGIGITSESPIDPGQVVKMYIPLGNLETLVPSFSEVRWIKKSNSNYRLGFKFIL